MSMKGARISSSRLARARRVAVVVLLFVLALALVYVAAWHRKTVQEAMAGHAPKSTAQAAAGSPPAVLESPPPRPSPPPKLSLPEWTLERMAQAMKRRTAPPKVSVQSVLPDPATSHHTQVNMGCKAHMCSVCRAPCPLRLRSQSQ